LTAMYARKRTANLLSSHGISLSSWLPSFSGRTTSQQTHYANLVVFAVEKLKRLKNEIKKSGRGESVKNTCLNIVPSTFLGTLFYIFCDALYEFG
jgi:hypothetical protein